MSPKLEEALRKFRVPFEEQCYSVVDAMITATDKFPIACVAVYGSFLSFLGPRSDVDILVLVRDNYKEQGFDLLNMRFDLEDIADAVKVNDVPIDLHFSVARDFFDTSRDRDFKLSFSENNIVYWEDGETLGPRLVEFS